LVGTPLLYLLNAVAMLLQCGQCVGTNHSCFLVLTTPDRPRAAHSNRAQCCLQRLKQMSVSVTSPLH
jgi:hypothetical protein